MPRRRVLPPGAHQRIVDRLLEGWAPKDIHTELERAYREQAPSYRTVQRVVAELTPKDPSGMWTLREDPDGEAAALILPVIPAAIEMSGGKLQGVTVAQARWIVRLRRVAPDLGERIVFYLAYRFALTETTGRGGPIEDTELWLGFAPWRSGEARKRYFNAIREGWIGTRQGSGAERVWLESDGQTTLTYRAGNRGDVPNGESAGGEAAERAGSKRHARVARATGNAKGRKAARDVKTS